MSEQWLKFWRSRPRLSRRGKIGTNLLLSALAACLLWAAVGYPLPTAELEFHRMERTHLMPRSEIVFTNGTRSQDGLRVSGSDGSVFALDGTELHLRGRWFAGTRENWAVLASLDNDFYGRFIQGFPLDGGLALAPLARYTGHLYHTGYWVSQGPGETSESSPAYVYEYHNFYAILLFGAPEETARVELTIREGGAEHTGGGWPLENGLWLLGVEEADWRPEARVWEIPYTLRLYDGADRLLTERSGTLWGELDSGKTPSVSG